MAGAVEEVAQTTRQVVSGLITTPVLLVLVIFQTFILVGTVYLTYERNKRDSEIIRLIFTHCTTLGERT